MTELLVGALVALNKIPETSSDVFKRVLSFSGIGLIFLQEAVSLWMLFCAAIIICGTALSANSIPLRRA